ncbi:MAG TPA: polysaccharide lyase family protein, partial [Tepidisphaeraceae bacterium]|nr:polysaccharide lyase family protein [Tepidisphaeraceae bacterium]
RQNIVNANSYMELNSSNLTTTTPVVAAPVFRIGTWDGTPLGFSNADKITIMHPTDVRMIPWAADSSGLTNFTVGVDPDSSFPMAEWHTQNGAAPFVDTDNRITFTLTSAQAATLQSLRIGVTRMQQGRPNINVNGSWSSSVQSQSSQPSSRGLTTGNWRGNNSVYIFNIPSGTLHSGTNTIDISCASGSTGTLYSGYHIYDAIDLVNTSSLTNASVLKTITLTPSNPTVLTNAQQQFTATAKDQFGAVIPANFAWSDINGVVDGTGLYTAPGATGSDTVTATSGTVSGSTNVTIAPPLQVNSASFGYLTQQAVIITFNKDVDTTKLSNAFTLVNLTTNTPVPAASIHLSYANKTGTFTFTTQLADGNYRATIPASATLTAGGEHLPSDLQLNFFTLRGDANDDAKVDVGDLGPLSTNYGIVTSGATWAQGDFNYDGKVDVADLGALASNYGKALATGSSDATAASTAAPASVFANTSILSATPKQMIAAPQASVAASIFSDTNQRLRGVGLE